MASPRHTIMRPVGLQPHSDRPRDKPDNSGDIEKRLGQIENQLAAMQGMMQEILTGVRMLQAAGIRAHTHASRSADAKDKDWI